MSLCHDIMLNVSADQSTSIPLLGTEIAGKKVMWFAVSFCCLGCFFTASSRVSFKCCAVHIRYSAAFIFVGWNPRLQRQLFDAVCWNLGPTVTRVLSMTVGQWRPNGRNIYLECIVPILYNSILHKYMYTDQLRYPMDPFYRKHPFQRSRCASNAKICCILAEKGNNMWPRMPSGIIAFGLNGDFQASLT